LLKFSEEKCIKALQIAQDCVQENLSISKYKEWRNGDKGYPNEMTIILKFGTWNKAKKKAGLPLTVQWKGTTKKEILNVVQNGEKVEGKKCVSCDQEKALTDFHRLSKGVGGRNAKCKDCYNEYKRQHHHENKERMNLKSRMYYIQNKERIISRQKAYRERKKENS